MKGVKAQLVKNLVNQKRLKHQSYRDLVKC